MFVLFGILFLILVVWTTVLTFFFWTLSGHYNNLVKSTNKKTLQGILESILSDISTNKKDIARLNNLCDTIIRDGHQHIQKIGLIRFNPFKETGGDQSFVLSLLDKENNGVIISGLYSRAGTRWYAKKVKKGAGTEHNLSEEEKDSIKKATTV